MRFLWEMSCNLTVRPKTMPVLPGCSGVVSPLRFFFSAEVAGCSPVPSSATEVSLDCVQVWTLVQSQHLPSNFLAHTV